MDDTKPNQTQAQRGPCVKCGSEARNPRGQCKACKKICDAAYGLANREKINAGRNEWRKNNAEDKAVSVAWVKANPEKVRESRNKWKLAHPETMKGYAAKWRAENPEQARAIGAAWRVANADEKQLRNSLWGKSNRARTRVYCQNRRARTRLNGGELSEGIAQKLYELQRGKCACCQLPLGTSYQLDHIMPILLGGANTDDNIQLLRRRCNAQKHAKHPIEFMQSRGFLL